MQWRLFQISLWIVARSKRKQVRNHSASAIVTVFIIIQATSVTIHSTACGQMQCGHSTRASGININGRSSPLSVALLRRGKSQGAVSNGHVCGLVVQGGPLARIFSVVFIVQFDSLSLPGRRQVWTAAFAASRSTFFNFRRALPHLTEKQIS